jgi:hypothetical protein
MASVPFAHLLYWWSEGHCGGSAFLELLTCGERERLTTGYGALRHASCRPRKQIAAQDPTASFHRAKVVAAKDKQATHA